MRQLFERYDLLLSPTLPCAAFDVGHDTPPGLGARNIVSWVYYTLSVQPDRPAGGFDPGGLHRFGSAGRPADGGWHQQ